MVRRNRDNQPMLPGLFGPDEVATDPFTGAPAPSAGSGPIISEGKCAVCKCDIPLFGAYSITYDMEYLCSKLCSDKHDLQEIAKSTNEVCIVCGHKIPRPQEHRLIAEIGYTCSPVCHQRYIDSEGCGGK